jgi:GTPase SAR1 family protein
MHVREQHDRCSHWAANNHVRTRSHTHPPAAVPQAAPDDPATFPFILLGNKADEASDRRMVTERQARGWAEGQGNMPYLETSAKGDTNVSEAFQQIVALALSSRRTEEPALGSGAGGPGAGNLDFSEGARARPRSSCC